MRISEATEIVSDLAAQQWGLLTAAQAREVGVAAFMLGRLVDRRILTRVRHGVYAAASTPSSAVLEVRAQWLALEPKMMAADRESDGDHAVVVSHATAAELHSIGDLPTGAITFTTSRRRQTKQPDVQFHTATLASDDVVSMDGLPVTTVATTVRDLARAGHEPGHLTDLMTDALSRSLVTKTELAAALGEIAEILGASGATEQAMRQRLDELAPTPDAGDEALARAVRKVVAPLERQIQDLLAGMTPQVQVPAETTRHRSAEGVGESSCRG